MQRREDEYLPTEGTTNDNYVCSELYESSTCTYTDKCYMIMPTQITANDN